MRILMLIDLTIAILVFVFSYACVTVAGKEYKKYNFGAKKKKLSFAEYIISWIRFVIMCLLPIYNVLVLFLYVFKWDYMVDMAYEKIDDCIEE